METAEKNKVLTTEEKAAVKMELLKKHWPILSQLGYDPLFSPKWIFGPRTDRGFSILASELKHRVDIYTEMVKSEDFASTDPTRTLYRWKYNPEWKTDYPFVEEKGYYKVPATELQKITCIEDIIGIKKDHSINVVLPSDKTLMELAALLKRYINQVISESK